MVAAKDMKGLLLRVGELERIAGDTTMTNVGVTTEANRRLDVRVQPAECRYPGNSGSSAGYGGPSNVAFVGDAYQGANRVYVEQNVAGYDGRGSAVVSAFNAISYGWELCPENEPFTIFTDSTFFHYVRGPVDAAPRRVAVTVTKQEPPRRACRHVAAAKANVIAEAVVCGDGDVTGPADEIVEKMLAKVPD
jgi:hypothetical protein